MSQTASDRHKAENEVIFRKHNEHIKNSFDEIKRLAIEDDQEHLIPKIDDVVLQFYCECSDENCRLRITMDASEYNQIHKNRRQFVIVPGHETESIEKIIAEKKDYFIVEKFLVPKVASASFKALNSTDANNV